MRESPTKTGQTIRTIGAQPTPLSQKSSDSSSAKKVNNFMESPNETEGRQLRKRIKTTANDETNDSLRRSTKGGDISKIDDDEDGEIYEVDFSNIVPQESTVGEARQRFSAALVGGNANNDINTTNINANSVSSSPSSRAIVASTLAYHQTMSGVTHSTPSQVNTTRTLRRSTSSHGSASTQSMAGENGTDMSAPDVLGVNSRRKGPGRTPTWIKEQESRH